MDLDDVPELSNNINYEEVGALSQRRIIAFFNEFVGQTVSFLNKFSTECEEKLFVVDTRLEKLETMLSILEAKLSSVPGLTQPQRSATNGESATTTETSPPDSTSAPPTDTPASATEHTNGQPPPQQHPNGSAPAAETGADESPAPGMVRLRQTEPYRRYFRMLEVGVPEPAVRIKMQAEGVDPDALQRGDELVQEAPPAGHRRRGSHTDDSDAPSWDSEAS